MRHVLGRHYTDLQGKGAAWTFAHHYWDTFINLLSKEEEKEISTQMSSNTDQGPSGLSVSTVSTQTDTGKEEGLSMNSISTQTTTEKENKKQTSTYLYDVEDGLRKFVNGWAQKHNIAII